MTKAIEKPTRPARISVNIPDGFYEVVDNIAIPAKHRKSAIETKYAFLKDMEVSQTKCIKFNDKAIWNSVCNVAANYGKKYGKTFVPRTIPEDQGGGYGLWRIA